MVNNLTGLQNITRVPELFSYASELTSNLLGIVFYFALLFVLLSYTGVKYGYINGFILSSFVCFTLSFFMVAAGFLSFYFLILSSTLLAFSLMAKLITK